MHPVLSDACNFNYVTIQYEHHNDRKDTIIVINFYWEASYNKPVRTSFTLNPLRWAPIPQNGQTRSKNCLCVFDHSVGLALKGLTEFSLDRTKCNCMKEMSN